MLALVKEYFWIFFISMVPIVELRVVRSRRGSPWACR